MTLPNPFSSPGDSDDNPAVTFEEPKLGSPGDFSRLLRRIGQSRDGDHVGVLGKLVCVTTIDSDERDALEGAVTAARVGDRIAILGGVARTEDDEIALDPLGEGEAQLLTDTLGLILPELAQDRRFRVTTWSYPVPFPQAEAEEEDEDEEVDDDLDEDEGAEDHYEPEDSEEEVGSVLVFALLRVA